jgi:tetrahydrodipicolinate N-succinyltransferase
MPELVAQPKVRPRRGKKTNSARHIHRSDRPGGRTGHSRHRTRRLLRMHDHIQWGMQRQRKKACEDQDQTYNLYGTRHNNSNEDQRRRKSERTKPSEPIIAKKTIIEAIETGSLLTTGAFSVKTGTITRGAGVNVGRRVDVGMALNCAARVGSMVAVAGGADVGGGSTIRKDPGDTATSGE